MFKLNMIIFRVWEIALVSLILWSVGQVNGLKADEPRIWWGKVIWQKLTIKRVALLPLTPVPRPPTIREEKRGLRPFVYGGPNMAIVKGQKIYVVDDMYFVDDRKSKNKRKLLECSMEGKILREIDFPKDAPEYPVGCLTLCNDLLWIGLEGPYAFAVDLNRWRVIKECRLKGEGRIVNLFVIPDGTLYASMFFKRTEKWRILWRIIKINPDGSYDEQVLEGWRPFYVDKNGVIYYYYLNREIKLGYAKFGNSIKNFATISADDLGVSIIDWVEFVGSIDASFLFYTLSSIKVSKRSEFVGIELFFKVSRDGQVKVIGEHKFEMDPKGLPMAVRSVHLQHWSVYDGQIYYIGREDIGEHSRFWLMRLKSIK